MIEKAVANIEGHTGSKDDIMAMAAVLYPPLANDTAI